MGTWFGIPKWAHDLGSPNGHMIWDKQMGIWFGITIWAHDLWSQMAHNFGLPNGHMILDHKIGTWFRITYEHMILYHQRDSWFEIISMMANSECWLTIYIYLFINVSEIKVLAFFHLTWCIILEMTRMTSLLQNCFIMKHFFFSAVFIIIVTILSNKNIVYFICKQQLCRLLIISIYKKPGMFWPVH